MAKLYKLTNITVNIDRITHITESENFDANGKKYYKIHLAGTDDTINISASKYQELLRDNNL